MSTVGNNSECSYGEGNYNVEEEHVQTNRSSFLSGRTALTPAEYPSGSTLGTPSGEVILNLRRQTGSQVKNP